MYVDDIVLAGSSDKQMMQVKETLAKQFQVKDMGELHYFWGLTLIKTMNPIESELDSLPTPQVSCKSLAWNMQSPVNTPLDTAIKLVKATEEDECVDKKRYQSAVGSLLYLSTATRPHITYAVSNVAKYSAKPTSSTGLL